MMKAAIYEGRGSFRVGQGTLVPPGTGEVRLDVAYCGICGTDLHIAHGAMDARIRPPQIIGHEMSGTVAELGEGVPGLQVGDAVVVRPLDTRGETPADRGFSHIARNLKFLGIDAPGALQASWTVPAFTVHRVPEQLDLRVAAFSEPLTVTRTLPSGPRVRLRTSFSCGQNAFRGWTWRCQRARFSRMSLSVRPLRTPVARATRRVAK